MKKRELIRYCLKRLEDKGADKAQCKLSYIRKQELNVHAGKLNLLRTNNNLNLNLTAIFSDRKGSVNLNKTDTDAVDKAIESVVKTAESSQADPANDIAGFQEAEEFRKGPGTPDLALMYDRLADFLAQVKDKYPRIILEEVILDHTIVEDYFMNSNKVDYYSARSAYHFWPMFTAKEGLKTSSFNYTGFTAIQLDRDLLKTGTISTLLEQSSEQIVTRKLNRKFEGEIIVTPDCMADMIHFLTSYLGDRSLISGTSIYKEKMGKNIAASSFTLESRPRSGELADGYFFTHDGFKAENSIIIEKGKLKSFLLSLYGANKTGLDRGANLGDFYVIRPGQSGLDNMIGKVEKGVLLCRFSGGQPNDKGDFSGVAKNSYFIENGKIKYPLSETMISGNIAELFMNVLDISRETVNFGNTIMPWIRFSGINISG